MPLHTWGFACSLCTQSSFRCLQGTSRQRASWEGLIPCLCSHSEYVAVSEQDCLRVATQLSPNPPAHPLAEWKGSCVPQPYG